MKTEPTSVPRVWGGKNASENRFFRGVRGATIGPTQRQTVGGIIAVEDKRGTMNKRIGVISDTHGQLRAQVVSRLRGCDAIIHAGDIGSPSVLEELRRIAEVIAVRGNVDTRPWAAELPAVECQDVEGRRICIVHDIGTLDLDPEAAGVSVVVYGHSHKPAADWRDGILYLNPGSAGPKRFHLPASMAFLHVKPDGVTPEIIPLLE